MASRGVRRVAEAGAVGGLRPVIVIVVRVRDDVCADRGVG